MLAESFVSTIFIPLTSLQGIVIERYRSAA